MAEPVSHTKKGTPIYALEEDPSPEFAVLVDPETGTVHHWIAFLPFYGPESEKQIEWWRDHGYPGAEHWEVGKPIRLAPEKKAREAMRQAAKEGPKR